MFKTILFLMSIFFNLSIVADNNDLDFLKQYDINFRKLYCNNEYREKIHKLPDHLKEACWKMGINPDDIQVFQENWVSKYYAHTHAHTVSLAKGFWTDLNEEEQAWYFAHELSHVKHGDTIKQIYLERNLVDFQIGSSVVVALAMITQIARKRLHSLPSVLVCSGMYTAANIAAQYVFYKGKQNYELRANDEAGRAVGVHAAIPLLERFLWSRDHGQNENIRHRLKVFADKLGFCDHGSHELQIERLKKLEFELSKKND